MSSSRVPLWTLFKESFILSAFTFGGGFVIVSLMKKKFVDGYHWLEEQDMLNLVAIAQSAPGVIAVNAAIIVGYQLAGWLGILVSLVGTILPPFVVITLVARSYDWLVQYPLVQVVLMGMQAGVGAILVDVVFSLIHGLIKEQAWGWMMWMVVSFVALTFFELHILWVIAASACVGLISLSVVQREVKL